MNLEISLNLQTKSAVILKKHIELLKAISKTKSITNAAKELGISYKNAWDSIDFLNQNLQEPVIFRIDSNKKFSGSDLTKFAKNLVENYDKIIKHQQDFLDAIMDSQDLASPNLKLKRINMEISARNQIPVVINKIDEGAVNVQISANDGELNLKSIITKSSKERLNLSPNKRVNFIFKASNVLIAKGEISGISAANLIKGKISKINLGSVNAEIEISVGKSSIFAIITNDSARNLKLGVGDSVTAIIKASDILVGV